VSDIDIVVADGLKVLDLKRPIREADVSSKGLVAFIGTRPGLGLTGLGLPAKPVACIARNDEASSAMTRDEQVREIARDLGVGHRFVR